MSTKLIVKHRPRSYPLNHQQLLFKEAVESCNIRKGMSRSELVEAMTNCIPEFYRKWREQNVQKGD